VLRVEIVELGALLEPPVKVLLFRRFQILVREFRLSNSSKLVR
jgi:hypothetical protein